jgi:hypothetical protein
VPTLMVNEKPEIRIGISSTSDAKGSLAEKLD